MFSYIPAYPQQYYSCVPLLPQSILNGSYTKQKQELIIDSNQSLEGKKDVKNSIRQTQKAGKNSEQVQIGRINDGK